MLIVALVLLLAVAIFLGAAEAAVIRVPRSRVAVAADRGDHSAKRVLGLVENLPQVMNTILLVVLLAQVGAATLVGVLAERHFGNLGVTLASIALTLVMFVYAEAIPKTFAVGRPLRVCRFVAPVVGPLATALKPVTSLLVAFADLQAPGKGIAGRMGVSEEELRFLAEEAASSGEIEPFDHELIERGFEFGDLAVEEIVVPRTDIVSVDAATPVREALDVAVAAGHRRVVVHEGSLDSVVGAVRLRDLAAAVADGSGDVVRDLLRPVLTAPESKRVIDLLREMQHAGNHIAVVIDEHGGTTGMVTIEDLVEELVGQVSDEGEVRRPPFEELEPGVWEVDTRADVDELEKLLGVELPRGEWHTVGGLVLDLAGRVPMPGETLEASGHEIEVAEATARRVQRVTVRRKDEA